MKSSERLRLGLDLGGSKIEAVILGEGDDIRARQRAAMPPIYEDALAAIADLVSEVERQAGATTQDAGIGAPGSISPKTGLMRNSNSTPLNGRAADVDLRRVLNRPVTLANDANCFALAEAKSGAGAGCNVVFGVILGTGVGGGIVVDGRPLMGRNAIGSEWGHNPLPARSIEEQTGPICDCGRNGCIEAWCSGPGLVADHFRRTGSELDPAMLAAFADAGDFEAKETLDLHVARLGRALAGVVNLLDPDVIVLGGGLSKMQHLYHGLPEAIRPHVFSDVFETPVVENRLGDSAGVIGAAWLCNQP